MKTRSGYLNSVTLEFEFPIALANLQSRSHQMEICRAMHMRSPVKKRHHTKMSYRKSVVFKVVCGDISKSELVLGTLSQ